MKSFWKFRFAVLPTLWNQLWPMELKIIVVMAKFFIKYGQNMATFLVNLDLIYSFYCIYMWQFLQKFQIGKEILQNAFWKTSNNSNKHDFLHDKENLKILRFEKFVLCNKHLWMWNCKVKFGQDGPKTDQKWPEMSKIFA